MTKQMVIVILVITVTEFRISSSKIVNGCTANQIIKIQAGKIYVKPEENKIKDYQNKCSWNPIETISINIVQGIIK